MTPNSDSEGPQKAADVVALTGFMGAGKSTVGRALATALGWTFLDLDEEIERSENLRIRELFRTIGEARFREIESLALNEVLRGASANTVIALGGGTFIQPINVALLHDHGACVVFLDAPVDELFQRCGALISPEENLRPLAADQDAFFALYEQRLPHYRKAHLVVGTIGKSASQVAEEIAVALLQKQEDWRVGTRNAP